MKARRGSSIYQAADGRGANESWKVSAPGRRDSDASLIGSRRSSSIQSKTEAFPISDRHYQQSAIRSINSYLSSHSFHITLTLKPFPSEKDIKETFRFVLLGFDWDVGKKMEDDLLIVLRCLGCPIKFNKSILKGPGAPHSWPTLLATLHWLVQALKYKEHLASDSSTFFAENELLQYIALSYGHFLRGDDEAVSEIDKEYISKLEQQNAVSMQNLEAMEKQVADLEAKVQGIKGRPLRREVLEKDKGLLKADIQKFSLLVKELVSRTKDLEASLENRGRDLEERLKEKERILAENAELRKKIDAQTVNVRDVDKMRREVQAVENEVAEIEKTKIGWEEKSWELQASAANVLKEVECLIADSNQAIKRLKAGSDFCFKLNSEGSTAVEVFGVDYKRMIKPVQLSFLDETKKSSKESLEDLVALQQQLHETSAQIDAKQNGNKLLLAKIEKAEVHQSSLKKDTQEYISHCATSLKKIQEDVEEKRQLADKQLKEAEERLKAVDLEHEKVKGQYDEEVQACGHELLQLFQAIVEHKEHNEQVLSSMKSAVQETLDWIAEAHKTSWSTRWGNQNPCQLAISSKVEGAEDMLYK
ncbi:kinetochore protein NDC80 homolog [Nymphaea colorata]|nr:kinetochore protein NDC80 homolog [Nymphaea colorata]